MNKKKLYLSNTSIKTFLACKRKFKFKYVDKIKNSDKEPNKYLSFGTSMHMALADFNRITHSHFKILDTLHNLLRKNWIRDGYESIEEEKTFGLRGLDMLTNYYNDPKDTGVENLLIEEMIFKETESYILCGKLDKVYKRNDQNVEILDYKTGNSIKPIDNIQLPLYLVLTKDKIGYYPHSVGLYYLPKNEKSIQVLTDKLIERSIQYVFNICDRIIKEPDFEANPNFYCKMNCEYYNICDDAKNSNLIQINTLNELDKHIDSVF